MIDKTIKRNYRPALESFHWMNSSFFRTFAQTSIIERIQDGKSIVDFILLSKYISNMSSSIPSYLEDLAEETKSTFFKKHDKMLSNSQGRHLYFMARALRPRSVLDIGTFTGYSALCLADAVYANYPQAQFGDVVTCEVDESVSLVAKKYFEKSPAGKLIDLQLGMATDTLSMLESKGRQFDFVFVDADKKNYIAYYDLLINSPLLSKHGMIIFDNTLYRGEVALMSSETTIESQRCISKTAKELHYFNEYIMKDSSTIKYISPLFDGETHVVRV